MFILFIIALITGTSLYHTDLESHSIFFSVLLPIVDFFSLIALALWIVLYLHGKGIDLNARPGSGGDGFGDFFDGGGDGGGGGSDGGC